MSALALEELSAIAAIYCGREECEVLEVSGDCFAMVASDYFVAAFYLEPNRGMANLCFCLEEKEQGLP